MTLSTRRPPVLMGTLLVSALALGAALPVCAQGTRPRPGGAAAARAPSPFVERIERRAESILTRLADADAPVAPLVAEAREVMLEAIAWLPDDASLTFANAALAHRLTVHMADVPPERRRQLVPWLLENRRAAAAVAFAIDPAVQSPAAVYAVLERLHGHFGDALERFPNLTAAICVVHDRPFTRRINENSPAAPDPAAIFDFFVRTERNMLLGIREMPTELLMHVVDVTGTIDELEWMQRRHRGERAVGRLYFDIRYDHAHVRRGTPKRSTAAGWNLPAIAEHGGVCADQAYYAMMAGKAIGVPSVYVTGRGHDMGHAWVGFLQSERNALWFNFDFGRYEQYQGLKGDIVDPQRRVRIPDSFVGILAEMASTPVEARHASTALLDAAAMLAGRPSGPTPQRGRAPRASQPGGQQGGQPVAAGTPPTLPPAPDDIAPPHRRQTPRGTSVQDRLALTELALRQCPGNANGWRMLGRIAAEGGLDTAGKRRWAEILDRLCGRRYPEFSLAVLKPMVASVPEIDQQNAMWNALFESFSERRDLAAEVRLEQGRMWERAGNPDNAWLCYEDVIVRYANAGPFVLEALTAGERLIRRHGTHAQVLEMYRRVWSDIRPPRRLAEQFIRGSTWWQVGERYARALDGNGSSGEAAEVRARLAAHGR